MIGIHTISTLRRSGLRYSSVYQMNILPLYHTSFTQSRSFRTSSMVSQLIYKNKKSVAKDKESMTIRKEAPPISHTPQKDLVKSKDIKSDETQKLSKKEIRYNRMLSSKIYKKYTPNFVKPYIHMIYMRPINFTIAFAILHEISAIIPFFGFWFLFVRYDWMPLEFSIPAELVDKGLSVITKTVADMDKYNIQDKAKFLVAGANAYALTKLMMPLRVVFSIVLAPWFDKWFVLPVARFAKLIKAQFTRK